MSAAAEIKRLNREADRIARLLARAENRANDGAGVYSESQARADARHRRSQATIRTLQRIAAATGHTLIVGFRPQPKNGK